MHFCPVFDCLVSHTHTPDTSHPKTFKYSGGFRKFTDNIDDFRVLSKRRIWSPLFKYLVNFETFRKNPAVICLDIALFSILPLSAVILCGRIGLLNLYVIWRCFSCLIVALFVAKDIKPETW